MISNLNDIPESGDLNETPLPRLLVHLHRSSYEGALELSHDRSHKRFLFQRGAPVLAESNLASETLSPQLMDEGRLSREDLERVGEYMARKGCREGVALLALDLLRPKALFVALKDQVRRRLLEAFGWPKGRYRLDPEAEQNEDIQPFRCDPIGLLQEGLETHWSADRILADLTPRVEQFPRPGGGFDRLTARLRSDPATQALLAELDGQRSLGQLLGSAVGSHRALAAAWLLDAEHVLEYRSSPTGGESRAGPADFESEIEIEVNEAGKTAVQREPGTHALESESNRTRDTDDRAARLRAEIEAQRGAATSLDHYGLLGLESDATPAAIKKAYFRAAKQYHPDALARLGLEDLKEGAEEVFTRVSQAFEILSDERRRRDYDSSLRGEAPEIDTRRPAQAETSFRKGELLLRMGDFKGALEYLGPAVELWPEESAYQSALGWALYKKHPSEALEAQPHLDRAVELGPDDPVAHFRLGMVLRAAGEEESAARHLARAKQLDPNVG